MIFKHWLNIHLKNIVQKYVFVNIYRSRVVLLFSSEMICIDDPLNSKLLCVAKRIFYYKDQNDVEEPWIILLSKMKRCVLHSFELKEVCCWRHSKNMYTVYYSWVIYRHSMMKWDFRIDAAPASQNGFDLFWTFGTAAAICCIGSCNNVLKHMLRSWCK